MIEKALRSYCDDNENSMALSNVVVNQDMHNSICNPGMVWNPATLTYVLLNDCPSCIGDLDNNNNVGTSDLLLFLVDFGDNCE